MESQLEEMSAFFAARLRGYDEHMLRDVGGCREGYRRLPAELPEGTRRILDLGCGTGLELSEIFRRLPDAAVTGIDLCQPMLDALAGKFQDKLLDLCCGDYFGVPFGRERFDAAVSFESLHHFTPEAKLGLYRKIYEALKPGGRFVYGDYMAEGEAEEAFYFAEYARLTADLPAGAYYHYDTPLTLSHELDVLQKAGFSKPRAVWREENTVLIAADRI